MKATKLLLGVLGAAAAGVAIGLLIAPDKGSETRKKISKKTEDWKNQMTSLIETGKEYLNDLKGTFGKEADDLKDEAQSSYEKIKSEIS